MVTANSTQSLIQKYIEEVWVKKDLSHFDEYFNEDATFSSPFGAATGLPGIRQHFIRFQNSFSQLKVEVWDMIIQGNKCVVCFNLSGTCTENFYGLNCKHKQVSYNSIVVFYLQNNKIEKCLVFPDVYTLLTQVGAIAPLIRMAPA